MPPHIKSTLVGWRGNDFHFHFHDSYSYHILNMNSIHRMLFRKIYADYENIHIKYIHIQHGHSVLVTDNQ